MERVLALNDRVFQRRTGRWAYEGEVDFGADGRIISIEVLDVSQGVVIHGLPEPGLVKGLVDRLAVEHGGNSGSGAP